MDLHSLQSNTKNRKYIIMNFQILESKLNTHSIEELEMQDPNTFGVLVDKMLHIALNPTKLQRKEITKFAESLANNDSGKPNNKVVYHNHIRQDKITKSWIASRTIRGERYKKVNKDKNVVEQWYKQLCINENIKP